MVALECALRYPERLSHLVLLDTCGDLRWAQKNAPGLLAQRGYSPDTVNLARRFLNGQIASNEMMSALMKLRGAYYPYPLSLVRVAQVLATGLRAKPQPEALIHGYGQSLRGWTVMDRLVEIRIPTLIMGGRGDFQFPPEHQAELAAGIANARLQIVDRAGHNPHQERPGEVMQAIREFIPAGAFGPA
jgi:proline iminopeptidase